MAMETTRPETAVPPGAVGATGVARWGLRLRIFLFFALIALGGSAAILVGVVTGYTRLGDPTALSAFVAGGALSVFLLLGLTVWIWLLFDENIAKPVLALSNEMRARAHADVSHAIDHQAARYLGDLAPAAAAVAGGLARTRAEQDAAVAEATEALRAEKAQLEDVVRESPTAMLVCAGPECRISLYNREAARLLGGAGAMGLDRPLAQLLDVSGIDAARRRISASAPNTALSLHCATQAGAPMRGRLRRLSDVGGDAAGDEAFLLTLDGEEADAAPGAEEPLARLLAAAPERAEFYDFSLLSDGDRAPALEARRLDRLTCVVFDTETTGLRPDQGDEIVQLSAVRIVGGRLLDGDVFDMLVNPRRPIPAASTEIHGITDAMVADAPSVDAACAQFHDFCHGATLVAHNAPFDMAFLLRRGPALGVRFDQPVLDTVLLSAVLFGEGDDHALDRLAERLGVVIRDQDRHTALGDARATARAFVKMTPMLAAQGVETLAEALTASAGQTRVLARQRGMVPAASA